MSCSWALRRIESDLAPYHDGRIIPLEVLETFSSSLELVYQELFKDALYDDKIELIRRCMVTFRAMFDMQYVQETQPRETPSQTQGRPRFVINSEQLSILLEQIQCASDCRHVCSFCQYCMP